jgi:hypothetical protein
VGEQDEYGADDGHRLAEALLQGVMELQGSINVSTQIDPVHPVPAAIETGLQVARTLVTTRLHGSLLGAFHGAKVIAVDQVRGGAKVTALCRSVGITVLNAWEAQPSDLARLVRDTPPPSTRIRRQVVLRSRGALFDASQFLEANLL